MRESERKSILVMVVVAVAAGLAGLIAYYAALGEKQLPALTGEAGAIRAAVARIEAESRGAVQEPQIQAAPRSVEALPAAEGSVEDTLPSPPDGYSFVSYHGEMPRARIAVEIDTGDELSHPGPDWLGTDDSIDALVAQAAAAGRDWSFGWIRLAEDARPNDVVGPLSDLGATALGSSGKLLRAHLPGDPALLQEISGIAGSRRAGSRPARGEASGGLCP